MSTTMARIATVAAGNCDSCRQQLPEGGAVHEFFFVSRRGSLRLQYATCAECHQGREPDAVSAKPVRALVSGTARDWKDGVTMNTVATLCTNSMGEFLAHSVIKLRFEGDLAA